MLFNSLEFGIFLPIIFLLYWFVFNKRISHQNFFLFVVSYIFYGWWDWRFLSLIFFSSIVDYFLALEISGTIDPRKRRGFLAISLIVNLGVLGFFKYFNFFAESFADLFQMLGFRPDFVTLNIILPVGISFYTFQTLSYTFDVYRGQMNATKNLVSFLAFVSFFPQLVAGPIERARDLLPQFSRTRIFNRVAAEEGLRQILWGLFKKIVIADNASIYVDYVFQNSHELNSSYLFLGIVYFAFQIYCDFSGYSDIAVGTAKLFDFQLSRNFANPYFSRDVGEFWRRWHISLSTWFRDYIYIPLGGNRLGSLRTIINTLIVFTVSGFWHGANWTFIFWGFLNGLYLIPLMVTNSHRRNINVIAEDRMLPSIKELFGLILTFQLTLIAWVFFRSPNISFAFKYIYKMLDLGNYSLPQRMGMSTIIPFILILMSIEWIQRRGSHGLEIGNLPLILRWLVYFGFVGLIAYFSTEQDLSFIYFQF